VVASLLADKVKDVGLDVEATESVQIPVGLDSGNFGVVVVVVGIGGADERLRHGIAEDQAEDTVALGVSLGFVECDENQSAAPEARLLVVDQRLKEVTAPLSSDSNRSVMAIACLKSLISKPLMFTHAEHHSYHVRCDEQPLRQLAFSQVLVEHGSILVGHRDVLLVGKALWGSVAVVDDGWMVLPDIVVCLGRLVNVAFALEARVRHIFLVGTPGDALVIKQIDNTRDVGRDLLEVVVVTSECVSANGCNVVGHGWVCHAEVVVNTDALRRKPLQIWVVERVVIIGVLEPDCHESVKDLSKSLVICGSQYGLVIRCTFPLT